MQRWSNVTLGEVFKGFARYRPFILTVLAIVMIGIVLPGTRPSNNDDNQGNNNTGAQVAAGQVVTPGQVGAGAAAAGTDPATAAGSADNLATTSGSTGGAGTSSGVRVGAASGSSKVNPLDAPDCDRATGRIKVPTKYAPACVAPFPKGTNNGGATSRGVTATEIVVAVRHNPNPDPSGQAILVAAGDNDTDEQRKATADGQQSYFEEHYQTYGRHVKVVTFDMSGDPKDDQAARADAIKVATEIKAFAALGGSGAYKDELVHRGVVCISCTTSEPIENYLKSAPYVWSTLLASSQAYILRAEYIAKKLVPGKAVNAGDPVYQTQNRKFALVWYETAAGEYKQGINFFIKELARYGITLADNISYILDLQKAQEDARVTIARLKDKGITSVIFAGDPLTPIFLTKEATNQQYRPEWIVTGSALTDTSFFARTYATEQWQHAFGVSALAVGGPQNSGDSYRLYVWHNGHPPEAAAEQGVMWTVPWLLYTGIHGAGPKLTPQTFRDGMFAFPTSGVGGFTTIAESFGPAGKLWPWDDYLLFDDMTEIWWDATASGKDETGKDGAGLYRYVDGGKRFLPGQWPVGPTKAFQVAGTVLRYDTVPAAETPPNYEHKHYH